MTALEYLTDSPDMPSSDFLLFPQLKIILEGQRFVSEKEIAARASTALTDESKTSF
jgi:hypothetical protein